MYGVGEAIEVSLTFSENVTVTGAPRLKIRLTDDDTEERWAAYHGGSGTDVVVFRYTPVAGDDSDGVAVVENTLERDRGTIRTTSSGDPVSLPTTASTPTPSTRSIPPRPL